MPSAAFMLAYPALVNPALFDEKLCDNKPAFRFLRNAGQFGKTLCS
jgi:hypothetical protein